MVQQWVTEMTPPRSKEPPTDQPAGRNSWTCPGKAGTASLAPLALRPSQPPSGGTRELQPLDCGTPGAGLRAPSEVLPKVLHEGLPVWSALNWPLRNLVGGLGSRIPTHTHPPPLTGNGKQCLLPSPLPSGREAFSLAAAPLPPTSLWGATPRGPPITQCPRGRRECNSTAGGHSRLEVWLWGTEAAPSLLASRCRHCPC